MSFCLSAAVFLGVFSGERLLDGGGRKVPFPAEAVAAVGIDLLPLSLLPQMCA